MGKILVLLVVMISVCLTSTACVADEQSGRYIEQLKSGQVQERLEAARQLESWGSVAQTELPAIVTALKVESSEQVKLRLIGLLEKMGTEAEAATSTLIACLGDSSLQVSFRARRALTQVIDSSEPLNDVVVPHLINGLKSADPEIRSLSTRSLERLPAETAVKAIEIFTVLENAAMDLQVRLAAASVLEQLGDRVNEIAEDMAKLLTAEPNATVQVSILKIIGKLSISDPQTISFISEMFLDENADLLVRLEAASVLASIGPLAVTELSRGLDLTNKFVRRAAIQALGEIGIDASEAVPALIDILMAKDENLIIHQASAWALAEIDQEAADELRSSLVELGGNDYALYALNHHFDQADYIWIKPVLEFAQKMLIYGKDTYGNMQTPLFVDGLNVTNLEPVRWVFEGNEWIVSNFANQQNFLRTLAGLTNLTDDQKYRQAAVDATEYMLNYYRSDSGLLYWGGHTLIDLETDQVILGFDSTVHEFKNNFPFYELMWEVDADATEKFISAYWNAHITDWSVLDMNRHGRYDKPLRTGITNEFKVQYCNEWTNEFVGADPFFVAEGLSFINSGSDLIYSAAMLYSFNENEQVLDWSKHLAEQYVNARDPKTKLGAFQYSQSRSQAGPPDVPNPQYEWQTSGDRAQRQFGREFGKLAYEGKLLLSMELGTIYGNNAIIQLQIAEMLGEAGEDFLAWTHEGMRAFAEYVYNSSNNTVRPMWTDGTDLAGYQLQRSGYYGSEGTILQPSNAWSIYLMSYAYGYRLTQDPLLWDVARGVARGHDLGDIGVLPGKQVDVNINTTNSDPIALFALLDIYRGTAEPIYLDLARKVGNNIIERYFHDGFFISSNYVNARIDSIEALALISLEAVANEMPDAVPRYNSGRGFIHGNYDGYGRTYDRQAIWEQTR